MAREFGGWPGDCAEKPLDQVLYWTLLMSQEVEVARLWEDVGPNDDVAEIDDADD